MGSHSSFRAISSHSKQTVDSFNESNFEINRKAGQNIGEASYRHEVENPPFLSGNQPRSSFRVFDDNHEPSASVGSFQIFEDAPPKIGHELEGAFSQPSLGAPSQEKDASEQGIPQPSQSNKGFGAGALEERGNQPSGNPTSSHQSFQIFDESACASKSFGQPTAVQSFYSPKTDEIRMPASATLSHDHLLLQQRQSLQDSLMMEMNLSDASVHHSTSLMSKIHLAASEDSVMETSQHHNASLMDCSELVDAPNDGLANSNVGTGNIIDPFSDAEQARLLESLPTPLSDYEGFAECDYPMPDLVPNEAVGLSDEWYTVDKLTGEGAFAKVYQASILSLHTDDHSKILWGEDDKVVLKVQKPACPWEFYISRVLHERLGALRNPVDVRPSLMYADNMHVFPDGSCLVTQWHRNLTLLDAVNEYNKSQGVMPEPLLLLFTVEILRIMEQMHACDVIHGDIKPDNFLLIIPDDDTDSSSSSMSEIRPKHVKLIDFGRSIDMRLFPQGTTFRSTCNTAGFMCPEMLRGRPWTYQTDLFGLAATVHCLMFGSYMKVYEECGRWKQTSNIKRSYATKWKKFFDTLLNIPSSEVLPCLCELRRDLEETLAMTQGVLGAKMNKLVSMLFPK